MQIKFLTKKRRRLRPEICIFPYKLGRIVLIILPVQVADPYEFALHPSYATIPLSVSAVAWRHLTQKELYLKGNNTKDQKLSTFNTPQIKSLRVY